jgi:uncharacterized protein (TIGR02145 family)
MKKLLLAFLTVICTIVLQAQDYKITFSLTGEINEIDSVIVENATQQTSVKLNGTDTLILTKVVSSIHQIEKSKSLQLQAFPNPSATYFTFQFSTNEAEPVFATVYDLSGRKLISKKWNVSQGNHSFQLKNLPTGIFLVQLKTNQYSDKLKIISTRNNGTLPEITSFQTKQKTDETFPTKSATSAQLLGYEEYDNITVRVWPTLAPWEIRRGFIMGENPPVEEGNEFVITYQKCEDACGNVYNTVELGDQVWMAENFRCATDNSWVYNDDENNAEIYGRLYTWEDALNNAPEGWHLPSNEEWNKMQEYVQNTYEDDLPVALKSKSGWNPDENQNSTNGTDATGFNMVPGGARWFLDGTFYAAGDRAYFWTSTEYDSERARMRKFTSSDTEIGEGASNVGYGFSVRYVKDSPESDYETFTDARDGQTYKMVTIGEQTWMAENLKATVYNDSSEILLANDKNSWAETNEGAYCSYNFDETNAKEYGYLYNGYAVISQKLCPSGWHVPTRGDWIGLDNYLGYQDSKKLKHETWNGTNESGFSALPGGAIGWDGSCKGIGEYASWWSTDTYGDTEYYYYRSLSSLNTDFDESHNGTLNSGKFVRCIKD